MTKHTNKCLIVPGITQSSLSVVTFINYYKDRSLTSNGTNKTKLDPKCKFREHCIYQKPHAYSTNRLMSHDVIW